MTNQDISQFLLENVALFQGFTTEALDQLVTASELSNFEGNEAIIEYGGAGDHLCVMIKGEAEVSVSDLTGGRLVIGLLKTSEVFGEMAILTGEHHVADVIAHTRCFVLRIPKSVVAEHLLKDIRAIGYLSRLLTERSKELALKVAEGQIAPSSSEGEKDPYLLSLKSDMPGKIVSLNVGISQIRFGVHDTQDESVDVHGILDNNTPDRCRITLIAGDSRQEFDHPRFPLEKIFQIIFESLPSLGEAFRCSPHQVIAVGHRVVHGGNKFDAAAVITPQVIADIEKLSTFAPLHNPANLAGIRAAQAYFPDVPHVAVFDTAFHHSLPTYAYLYGLPYDMYKKEGIRRYGFHGTSHRFVSLKAAEVVDRPLGELEIVSCHLGIGASLCAIDHGRSVDTSMGMTPSDGLIMPSRAGQIDPAVMIHLMEHYKMGPEDLRRLINSESGLKGISGISSCIEEIEEAANEGKHRALLAHKAFCYQIRKNIGAYVAVMGGVDVLAFTGHIGETSATVRSLACQGLAYMGIKLDEEKNRNLGKITSHAVISAEDSKVTVLVVANNDEHLLAWETLRALERNQINQVIEKQREAAPIPIEISAHHVHLSQADVEKLFGPGYQLTPEHELSQPGQFACAEKVNLVGPKGKIGNVRVLGPTRKETQVEIAMTEQFKVGVQPPIRESGDLVNTPGLTLEGPYGSSVIERGVICAQRHIHMTPDDALRFGLRDRYVVRVRIEGDRELIFGDVVVRVSPSFRLAMHIDTDEGNAGNIRTGMLGYIEEIQVRR